MNLGNKGKANAKAPVISAAIFYSLPDSSFVRQSDLVRNRNKPEVVPLLPFSAATLWRKVKKSEFPAPTMLGPKITVWRVGQIKEWLAAKSAL